MRAELEEPALVRCSSCLGPRTVAVGTGEPSLSVSTAAGEKSYNARRSYAWWLERFSPEECATMAARSGTRLEGFGVLSRCAPGRAPREHSGHTYPHCEPHS